MTMATPALVGSEESPWLGSNLSALIDLILYAMANPDPVTQNAVQAFRLDRLIGKEYLTSMDSPPQVVWVPISERYEHPHEQPDDGQAVLTKSTTLDVYCWGSTGAQTEALQDALLVQLWETFSSNATPPPTNGVWGPFVSAGTYGLSVKMQVTLRVPVYRQRWVDGTIQTVNAGTLTSTNVSVTDALGSNPTPLP